MCRYAYKTYKPHFACFTCRKVFRKPPLEDYLVQQGLEKTYASLRAVLYIPAKLKRLEAELGVTWADLEARYLQAVSRCPGCGQAMAMMGLDFRPPRLEDEEAWQLIALLYDRGFSFRGCGCGVGFTPPASLRELPAWLEEHERKSEGEKLLEAFKARRG